MAAVAYPPNGLNMLIDVYKRQVKWVPWTPEKDAQAAPEVRGLHTGKADGSTVSFSGLTGGEQYVLIIAKDKNGDLLAPENLLYIAQGAADADGALTFATAPRESRCV